MLKIEQLTEDSPLLSDVITLADQNTQWLGFFARDAFREAARKGWLLVACSSTGEFLGYLLYFVARDRAKLQHLCVCSGFRSNGVARTLVDTLKNRTGHLRGIELHCARDFPSHGIWPRLEFIAEGEKPGRGKIPRKLTRFWFEHQNDYLVHATPSNDLPLIVLDTNVMCHMFADPPDRESALLSADWLSVECVFAITPEYHNEVDRETNEKRRAALREHARLFLPFKNQNIDALFNRIVQELGKPRKPSDHSDYKHLAHSIKNGAACFVTLDLSLQKQATRSDWIREKIHVLRPSELISMFDETLRAHDYAPARLHGSEVRSHRVRSDELESVTQCFLATGYGERAGLMRKKLAAVQADTKNGVAEVVEDAKGNPLALIAWRKSDPISLTVELLRIRAKRLAGTLARNLLFRAVREASSRRLPVCILGDDHPAPSATSATGEFGFLRVDNQWQKLNLFGSGNIVQVCCECDRVAALTLKYRSRADDIAISAQARARTVSTPLESSALERHIWPWKLLEADLATFIVPIQARWARELFEHRLAGNQLFPAESNLMLSCENVYFRSARPKVGRAPGRILWFVTRIDGRKKTGELRACSSLDEVTVGDGKTLFRQFERLGVYGWRDVKEISDNHPDGQVMGYRFSATELLPSPLKRAQVLDIIQDDTKREAPPLSTTLKISESCFRKLYSIGQGQLE